jgi:hypothetical protein
MATDFSSGLLSGFQFMESIADRRERRRQADEQIGLQRAADSRAEAAFTTQQEIISDTRLRQRQTDSASTALARAQSRGIDNLEPYELAELEEQAAFNPNIAGALQEMRMGKRDTAAIQDIAGMARRPQSLGDVAMAAQQPAPTPVDDGSLSPEQLVTQGAGEELPPGQPGGTRTVHNTYLKGLIPGIQIPDEMLDPQRRTVELPAQMIDDLEAAKDLPMVERQQIVDRARAVLGDGNFSATVQAAKAATAAARDTVASYRGFVDPTDETGADLRRMAVEDPMAAAQEFADDFNTLKETDPNTLAIVEREMMPVVNRATGIAAARVRALPVQDGRVTVNAESRAAMGSLNRMLSLQQNMSDGFKGELQAQIRRGSMPVGNAELGAQVAATVAAGPRPGMPETGDQLRSNLAMARRAVNSVADGARNLSTRQVESLAWLTKRGYISPDGFEQFLSTGTFQKPSDADFFSHNPDNILYAPDGTVLYMPPKPQAKPEDVSAWAPEQQTVIDQRFAPPPNATPEQVEHARRLKESFYITMGQNPEKLWGAGINVDDYRQMGRDDVALMTERYMLMQDARSEWDSSWLHGAGPVGWFRKGFDEQGVDVTNFDELAKKFDIEVPPLPLPKPQVDAARMSLAASDDETDRIMARIMSDIELGDAIIQSKEAQGPPAPLTTE